MKTKWFAIAILFAFAVSVFAYRFGFAVLDFTNVGWMLLGGDQAPDQLAWEYYRIAPWSSQLGDIPGYAYPQHPPIVLTGGIGFFALLCKPFDAYLPTDFQYFGFWFLLCYVLQVYFAWKVFTAAQVNDPVLIALASGFFVLFAAFIGRAPHATLCGHWIFLGQIYLYVQGAQISPAQRFRGHLLFLLVGVLAHPYFLIFNGVLILADYYQAYRQFDYRLRRIALHFASMGLVFVLHCYLWGFFAWSSDSTSSAGFGLWSANLTSYFNPANLGILPSLGMGKGQYEGAVYLGLGVLLLMPLAYRQQRQESIRPFGTSNDFRPLKIAAILLFCFALSHKIMLGKYTIFTIPLPSSIEIFLGKFRSAGRFAWLGGYLLVFWTLLVLLKTNRFSRKAKIGLLSGALCLQFFDLTPVLGNKDIRPHAPNYHTPYDTAAFGAALRRADLYAVHPPYERMLVVYDDYVHLMRLGYYYRKPVSSGNLARHNESARKGYQERFSAMAASGRLSGEFQNALFFSTEKELAVFKPLIDAHAVETFRANQLILLVPAHWERELQQIRLPAYSYQAQLRIYAQVDSLQAVLLADSLSAPAAVRIYQPELQSQGRCLVLDYMLKGEYAVSLDLWVTTTGWQMELFGRDDKAHRYLWDHLIAESDFLPNTIDSSQEKPRLTLFSAPLDSSWQQVLPVLRDWGSRLNRVQ